MEQAPQPQSVTTPAEFVAMLRQLRLWAGLSLRDLERRAAGVGGALPRATISGVLNRTELPREEFVVAYVRACGMDPETIELWASTRRRLAVASEPLPTSPTATHTEPHPVDREATGGVPDQGEQPEIVKGITGEPDSDAAAPAVPEPERASASLPKVVASRWPSGRVLRKRAALTTGIAAAIAAISLGILQFWPDTPSDDDTQPAPSRPATSSKSPKANASQKPVLAPGIYRMRAAGGQCVVERREPVPISEAVGLFLTPCTTRISDQITLKESRNGTYQIIFPGETGEPPRCLAIYDASRRDGGTVTIEYCDEARLNGGREISPEDFDPESFRLEKTNDHGGGFRIRLDDSIVPEYQRIDLCVGAPKADVKEWAQVFQFECLPEETNQVFQFLK